MRNFIAVIVLILCVSQAFAQKVVVPNYDVVGAKTLFAGVAMTARVAAAALDDTTQACFPRGCTGVWLEVVSSANDSAGVYVSYRSSGDGTTYNGFTVIDSLNVTGVGGLKHFPLPTAALGAYAVQFRIYGSAASSRGYSANPTTKLKIKIIRAYPVKP